MLKIFIGLIFTFFDLNIYNFDFLADFVGYILIFTDLKEFPDIASFSKAKTFSIVLLAYSLIDIILDIFGFANNEILTLLMSAVNIVVTVISIYLIYLRLVNRKFVLLSYYLKTVSCN